MVLAISPVDCMRFDMMVRWMDKKERRKTIGKTQNNASWTVGARTLGNNM